MKLLYLLWDTNMSGGARIVYEHANRLALRGHTTHIHNTRIDEYIPWFKTVARNCQFEFVRKPDTKYDAIISTYWATAYWSWQQPSIQGKRIYMVQNRENLFGHTKREQHEAYRTYLWDWDACICCAKHLSEFVAAQRNENHVADVNKCKVITFKNGLDLEVFRPITDKWKWIKPIVLIEGNLGVSWKNTEHALRAAMESHEFDVWHLGSNVVSDRCTSAFRNVHHGFLPLLYGNATVFLKCSRSEGDPMPVREAWACGTPQVVNNFLGATECVDENKSGIIVRAEETYKIVEALRLICFDYKTRSRMREYCLETREQFRWKPIIDKLEQDLQSVVEA